MAFEIVEQLGWRSPDHIVMPAAGGTLSSRVHKGLIELARVKLAETDHTKIHVAQPKGCAPIAEAILANDPNIHAYTPLLHSPYGLAPQRTGSTAPKNPTGNPKPTQPIMGPTDLHRLLDLS